MDRDLKQQDRQSTYTNETLFMDRDLKQQDRQCTYTNETLFMDRDLKQQDRQSTYTNETLKRVRVTIVALRKKQLLHILSVCACSLSYPAWKAHAQCYLFTHDLSGYTTFYPHCHKRHDFRVGGVTEHKMCVFIFSTPSILKNFSF